MHVLVRLVVVRDKEIVEFLYLCCRLPDEKGRRLLEDVRTEESHLSKSTGEKNAEKKEDDSRHGYRMQAAACKVLRAAE